ncbi:MAG: YicC/YloC family endoribonuclease, partial [Gallionella sp.]|nr:YicC/YloC family endoribonuclease [Gallionella sp.]
MDRELHEPVNELKVANRNIMRAFSTVICSAATFGTLAMILSMTGYAATGAELDSGSLTLELRAVNHRYLDIQLRMPDELRTFEGAMREAISAQLQRGKVDCRVNYAARSAQNGATLNRDLLRQLADWNREVQAALPDARSLSAADVLKWQGVLETPSASADELRSA